VRNDIIITVVMALIAIGFGIVHLSRGNIGFGFSTLFAAAAFLWLSLRNYRIARRRGWFGGTPSDKTSV